MNLFHDNARNISVYDTPTPMDIARVCPDAFQIYNGMVGVPATLQNLQRLRSINYPIIPPMERYDWPHHHTKKPWENQKTTANFLVANPRSFCLSGMRTGKTLSALWAADFVMSHYPRGACRTIIVATLKTLRLVWGAAIFENFLGRRTFSILHGTAEQRRNALAVPADFYIINHDGLKTGFHKKGGKRVLEGLAKDLEERTDIRICIMDEGSAYRHGGTDRYKASSLIANKEYLWWLTGTPTPQGPLDAHAQAKIVNGAKGESYTSYRNRVMYQLTAFKWVPRAGAMEEAKALLSPAIRFTQEDVFDSPPLMTLEMEAPLSAEQTRHFKEMKNQLRLDMRNGKRVDAANEAVLRSKLIQIACGAVYDSGHETHFLDAKPRMEVLREAIEEADGKVIIFAPLTSVLHLLQKELADFGALLVNGELTPKQSDERLHQFNADPSIKVLVAHPGPVSRGLDLTAAATIIWYCATDRTEDYLQANERINGVNQKRKRTIIQISSTPIEREIFRRLEHNETMQGVILKLAHEEGRQ